MDITFPARKFFIYRLFGEEADELRKRGGDGGEFGATTGRPRRMGWFDAVATRYGCRMQGATEVALTVLEQAWTRTLPSDKYRNPGLLRCQAAPQEELSSPALMHRVKRVPYPLHTVPYCAFPGGKQCRTYHH